MFCFLVRLLNTIETTTVREATHLNLNYRRFFSGHYLYCWCFAGDRCTTITTTIISRGAAWTDNDLSKPCILSVSLSLLYLCMLHLVKNNRALCDLHTRLLMYRTYMWVNVFVLLLLLCPVERYCPAAETLKDAATAEHRFSCKTKGKPE